MNRQLTKSDIRYLEEKEGSVISRLGSSRAEGHDLACAEGGRISEKENERTENREGSLGPSDSRHIKSSNPIDQNSSKQGSL